MISVQAHPLAYCISNNAPGLRCNARLWEYLQLEDLEETKPGELHLQFIVV